MPDDAFKALKQAYARHIAWMHEHAEKYETGKTQHLEHNGGQVVNKSSELAAEFRHRANIWTRLFPLTRDCVQSVQRTEPHYLSNGICWLARAR